MKTLGQLLGLECVRWWQRRMVTLPDVKFYWDQGYLLFPYVGSLGYGWRVAALLYRTDRFDIRSSEFSRPEGLPFRHEFCRLPRLKRACANWWAIHHVDMDVNRLGQPQFITS